MSIDTSKIKTFFSKLEVEDLYHWGVTLMIVIILIMASFALYRPINTMQFSQVLDLAHQQRLPQTQDIARFLVHKDKIHRVEYLKLMQAYHQESRRAHQLPPQDSQ